MARPLFPFVILGNSRTVTTTAADMPEMEEPEQPVFTRQANARDFRPTSTANRIHDEVVLGSPRGSDIHPKVLSATAVAESSPRGSLTFPRPLVDTSVPVERESKEQSSSDPDDEPKTTGSDGLLALEFTPELQTNPTYSSPAS